MNELVKRNIPFSPPDISELEIEEVVNALQSGWITTGPRTKELEKRLAEFCHTSKVVCLNSATAAEELNFRICGIGEGDEVIVPAYTYTATASAAIHCGAKVIFDAQHGLRARTHGRRRASSGNQNRSKSALLKTVFCFHATGVVETTFFPWYDGGTL